jgi:predicted lipoprotein with Yx(FWY)xxD motif
MKRIVLTLIGASVLAACGAASTSNPGNGSGSSTGTTVSTGTTSLGTVLTDEHGLTMYYFLPEKGGATAACDATCLSAWPPVVSTSPTSSSAVTGTLGVVSITYNGASVNEVTYNGWPLHTYSGDSAAGQVNGQNVENTWFAAEPATTADETGATVAAGSGSTPTPATTPTPASTSTGGYGY